MLMSDNAWRLGNTSFGKAESGCTEQVHALPNLCLLKTTVVGKTRIHSAGQAVRENSLVLVLYKALSETGLQSTGGVAVKNRCKLPVQAAPACRAPRLSQS